MKHFSSPGLLEEERLASAHQAEAFTRQIQNLQGTKNAEQWRLFLWKWKMKPGRFEPF